MAGYIIGLASRSATRATLVGGKGAGIARLQRQGFPVPDGFVVSVHAFEGFLDACGIPVLQHGHAWTQGDLERMRDALVACPMSDRLAGRIVSAYRRLGGRVAVRSSMVAEDAPLATFAGQLETVLNVDGANAVLRAIKHCWASVFSWRLAAYLAERNTLLSETLVARLSVAVVVQRMVDARAAGVAFSADPITGERRVLIEAVRGLGAPVVLGTSETDRYAVDAHGTISTSHLVTPGDPALGEQDVLALADTVMRVAARNDGPQDVEWAWDGEAFYVLQSRPITSLVGKHVYSNRMVGEMLPGLVKPLVWSIQVRAKLENVMGRIFSELIGPNEIDFSCLAKRIRSRVYADDTVLGELLTRLGMPANAFEVMSHGERAAKHGMPPIRWRTLRTLLRLARFVRRNGSIAGEISAYAVRHHQALEAYRGVAYASVGPEALLTRLDGLMALYRETMWYNFIGPLNMMSRNGLLRGMVRRLVPGVSPESLVSGLVGLKSLQPNHELEHIAENARGLGEPVCALLTQGADSEIRMALSCSAQGQALLSQVDAFLGRYGYLCAVGTDPSQAPWAEMPAVVWQAIGRAALHPQREMPRSAQEIRDGARSQVRAKLSPLQRAVFDRLLRSTMAYMALREQSSALLSEQTYELRRIFLALADLWVAPGILEGREDVFYLTLDEVRGIALDGDVRLQVRSKAAERRTEMAADAAVELPAVFCGESPPVRTVAPMAHHRRLDGIGGSAGRAEGRARIILDPAGAPSELDKNDILVVPFSDVGWTPLFACVGGIVAETGGQLSHSAIVAREYGLPAVVNVKNATRLIREGEPVVVDGSHGHVYVA
ncbi:MAG: hypothetical protein JXA09_16060 [Anaerolineae bacterium]|nr:hypothetical protein [Anaerolineae bacterium]